MTKTNSPEAGLESLAKFAAKWPMFANNVYMNQPKLGLLVRTKAVSRSESTRREADRHGHDPR